MSFIRRRKGNVEDENTQGIVLSAEDEKPVKKYRLKIVFWSFLTFVFIVIAYFIFSLIPFSVLWAKVLYVRQQLGTRFLWMFLTGFLAQLIDGALGMGYGVTCTAIMLSMGFPLPAISGSTNTAKMFSTGMSGLSHYRFGNFNKKLFKTLIIPGLCGAVIGAVLLSVFGGSYSKFLKPLLACYTLFLGVKILLKTQRKRPARKVKAKNVGWLAGAGGFLDAFGGGGWGPLVASTLISKGKTPRYVVGTGSVTEFFITLASALTFFAMIGIGHWKIIAGLVLGGLFAAPLAAMLAGKLPIKKMFLAIGSLVIIWSLITLFRVIHQEMM